MLAALLLPAFTACRSQPASNEGRTSGTRVATISPNIRKIFQDSKNAYWFGSDHEGLYRWDGKKLTQFTAGSGLPDDRVRDIGEDRSGNILINTLAGISRYDGKTFTTVPVTTVDSAKAWAIGPEDLLFPASQETGGVYRYDGRSVYHLELPESPLEAGYLRRNGTRPFSLYVVYTIYKDSHGAIWFGSSTFGACRFDGKSHAWFYEDHLNYIPNGGALGFRAIVEDRDGFFWFTNNRYKYQIAIQGPVVAGHEHIARKVLPGVIRADGSNEQDFIYYQSLLKDSLGQLWMGTYQNGIFRTDGSRMTELPVERETAKNLSVVSMYQDRQGQIWLATQDAGVLRFDGTGFRKLRF